MMSTKNEEFRRLWMRRLGNMPIEYIRLLKQENASNMGEFVAVDAEALSLLGGLHGLCEGVEGLRRNQDGN